MAEAEYDIVIKREMGRALDGESVLFTRLERGEPVKKVKKGKKKKEGKNGKGKFDQTAPAGPVVKTETLAEKFAREREEAIKERWKDHSPWMNLEKVFTREEE